MFTCECQVDWQLNISVAKLSAPSDLDPEEHYTDTHG